jgi:hypothetical protein
LINETDPFAENGQLGAYACRVYATESGLDGAPSVAQLVAALRRRPPNGRPVGSSVLVHPPPTPRCGLPAITAGVLTIVTGLTVTSWLLVVAGACLLV